MLKVCLVALLGILVGGCQQVTEVEFYPPSKDNEAYSIKSTKTEPGRGPIKTIKGRSGVPSFSDSKSFTFTVFKW